MVIITVFSAYFLYERLRYMSYQFSVYEQHESSALMHVNCCVDVAGTGGGRDRKGGSTL